MKKLFAFLLFAAGGGAQAQVEYLMDMLTAQLCLANNWDSASLQKRLAHLQDAQRAALQTELEMQFGAAGFACLRKARVLPEAGCDMVIDDMIHQQNPPVGGGNPFLSAAAKAAVDDAALEAAMRACLHTPQ